MRQRVSLRLLAATLGLSVSLFVIHSESAQTSGLWEPPVDLGRADLLNGPWGAANAPTRGASYTFVRAKRHGVNPGVVVKDPLGRIWHVKQPPHNSGQGAEGPVEVVLSRVLSAIGYHQPPVYYVPSFTMTDASGMNRRLEPGGRFRLDVPSLKAQGPWAWQRNPFVGTQPYEGLLVTLLVFNSWDLKDSNNTIYDLQRRDGTSEQWYVVRDLGAALGETGRMAPKRNNIELFERHPFITSEKAGRVHFAYGGWQSSLVHDRITTADVQWATALLSRLSDRQWHDAFTAGGYPPELADRFIQKIKANIAEGQHLTPDNIVSKGR